MRKFLGLGIILIVGLFHTNLLAQYAGGTAVPFLMIAPGAKAGGMGEGGVALATDPTAIHWNPAGLAFQYQDPEVDSKGEVTFMHSKWLPQFNFSDLFYEYAAARYYFEDIGMIGTSLTYLNLGQNVYTDNEGNELGTFDSKEWAFALSYSTLLQENLGIGVNVKFIQSDLAPKNIKVGTEVTNGQATSAAVDLGVLWTPAYGILQNKLRIGLAISNFGPEVTYNDKAQADPLPTNFRLGFAYKLFDDEFNRITLIYDINKLLVYRHGTTADGVVKAALYSSWVKVPFIPSLTHSIGLEYWYGNLIALRTGYFNESLAFGNRKFLTFGAGLAINVIGIDFGYISDNESSPLANTMRFSLSVKF